MRHRRKAFEPERFNWIYKVDSVCWVCQHGSDQVHHIIRRDDISGCKNDGTPLYDNPAILFLICTHCHTAAFHNVPPVRQLALKLKYDPKHFNLDIYNNLCVRGDARVTYSEIKSELIAIQS